MIEKPRCMYQLDLIGIPPITPNKPCSQTQANNWNLTPNRPTSINWSYNLIGALLL